MHSASSGNSFRAPLQLYCATHEVIAMFGKLRRRLRALFKRDKLEQELADELRYHLERDAEQNLKSGMDADEAYYSALKAFGNVDLSKEECRDARSVKFMEDLIRDIRYSIRLLIKNPAFS